MTPVIGTMVGYVDPAGDLRHALVQALGPGEMITLVVVIDSVPRTIAAVPPCPDPSARTGPFWIPLHPAHGAG